MRFFKYISGFLAAALIAASVAGCIEDEHGGDTPGPNTSGDGFVELSFEGRSDVETDLSNVVVLDEPSSEGTRAVSLVPSEVLDWEEHVETIDILVFESPQGNIDGTYLCAIQGVDIQNGTASGGVANNTIKFKAMMPLIRPNGSAIPNGMHLTLVFLANLHDEWDAIRRTNTIISGTTKFATVANKLKITVDEAWDVSPGSTKYLPMCGYVDASQISVQGTMAPIIFNTNKAFNRSVAAFDIGFNYDGDTAMGFTGAVGDPIFKIESATMANISDMGRMGLPVRTEGLMVMVEVVPYVPGATMVDRDYTLGAGNARAAGMFNEIYVPEMRLVNPSIVPAADRLKMLIGGYYTAPGASVENTTKLSWYAIDLHDDIYNMKQSVLPFTGSNKYSGGIMQNQRYLIKIDRIDGEGYATKEEAFDSPPLILGNLSVVPWDYASGNGVGEENRYVFDVSQTEFDLDHGVRDADNKLQENAITLYTDYPGGWKVDEILYNEPDVTGWLGISKTSGDAFETVNARITTTSNRRTGAARSGYIVVSAGRWKQRIYVRQDHDHMYVVTTASIYAEGRVTAVDDVSDNATRNGAAEGTPVTYKATPRTVLSEFDCWDAVGVTLTPEQAAASTVTFNMPANAVTLTARFRQAPRYTVTVAWPSSAEGYGGGSARSATLGALSNNVLAGDIVTINTLSLAVHRMFCYVADGVELTNEQMFPMDGNMKFTMPANDVTIYPELLDMSAEGGPNGGYAAPGVVGIKRSALLEVIASGQPSTDPDALTIKGSATYGRYPQIVAIADAEFGGLDDEIVYPVVFKWGSMVAMLTGKDQDEFGSSDVVWMPAEAKAAGLATYPWTAFMEAAASGKNGDNDIITNRAEGHGDICREFHDGLIRYRTPRGNMFSLPNGNDPFGAGTTARLVQHNEIETGYMYPGVISNDGSIFLNAVGVRNMTTGLHNRNTTSIYWTSTSLGFSGSYAVASALRFNSTAILMAPLDQGNAVDSNHGAAIRCVRQ